MRNVAPETLLVVLGLGVLPAQGALLQLAPVADTTLIEVAPTNNNGGQAWMNAGTTQNGPTDRALVRFDLSVLPANTLIRAAAVVLTVTHQPRDGLANAPFGLYRLLRPWGEGDKVNLVSPGQGLPASPGEATWLYSFYPTNSWSIPGGAAGVDFSGVESAFQFIYGVAESPYRFESTPELVADVQSWVNNPSSNYGWMLHCDDEGNIFTARRFGSREDTNNAPVLELDYIVPPRIDRIEQIGGQIDLRFTAFPGQYYVVEFRATAASGAWGLLAALDPQPQTTLVLVVDTSAAPQRFYRLMTY